MSYFLFIIFHIEMSTLKVSKKYTYTHFTDIFCFIFIHGTTIKYNIIFDIKEWHIRDTLFFCTDLVVSYMYIRMDQLYVYEKLILRYSNTIFLLFDRASFHFFFKNQFYLLLVFIWINENYIVSTCSFETRFFIRFWLTEIEF